MAAGNPADRILDDEKALGGDPLTPANRAIEDRVTGSPVLLARGPQAKRAPKKRAAKKQLSLQQMVDLAKKQARPLFKSYIKSQWNIKASTLVGRNVGAKVISKQQAVSMVGTIVKYADADLWDAWQVAFKQDPDFVVRRLSGAARGKDEREEIERLGNLDSAGKFIPIPTKYKPLALGGGAAVGQTNTKTSFESGNTAAFYVPREDKIYFIEDAWQQPTLSGVVHALCHELSHAYAHKHSKKADLTYSWRRLMLILEINRMNVLKIDDLGEGLAEWFGFEVYGQWWGKYGKKSGNVGARITQKGYQHRASVHVLAETLMGSLGGQGVSQKSVVQAYFNGTLTWQWPDPQDNLTLGAKKEPWAWPADWR